MLRAFTPYIISRLFHEKDGYYYDKRRGLIIYGDEPFKLEEGEIYLSSENNNPRYATLYSVGGSYY